MPQANAEGGILVETTKKSQAVIIKLDSTFIITVQLLRANKTSRRFNNHIGKLEPAAKYTDMVESEVL